MKRFTAGDAVEVRGVGHLAWLPATYVGRAVSALGGRGHVVEQTGGKRRVSDARIRAAQSDDIEVRANATDIRVARIRALLDNELAARTLDAVLAGVTNAEPEAVLGALVTAITIFARGSERTATEADELTIAAACALLEAANPVGR